MSIFTSPLEQFQVLPIFSINLGFIDISVTNEVIILLLIAFFSLVLFFSLVKTNDNTYFIVPNRWQSVIEIVYKMILSLVTENIKNKNSQYFFPLIFSVFFFIGFSKFDWFNSI